MITVQPYIATYKLYRVLKDNSSKNNQVQELIDIIGKNYYWQSYKM
jgi:hypothetical protein